jgi:hypothetical protein
LGCECSSSFSTIRKVFKYFGSIFINLTESLSNLGITTNIFKHPYYADNLLEAQSFLAGTKNFKVLDIEAYTLE